MKAKKKVSVIIPVYNGEKTLQRCLDSLLCQTYKNFEIIAVDNNSKDRTKKIIKGSTKIKYIFESKKGRSSARNAGIKAAHGRIIAMTDCDCIAPKDWLERLTELINLGKENIVMGFEEDPVKNYWTSNIQKSNCCFIKDNLNGRYARHIDTKNFAVKVDVIKQIMFDEDLHNLEDFDLYLRLKCSFNIRFVPDIMVRHYHKDSLSSWFKLQFDRGYWCYRIYRKHKYEKNIKNEPMFQSLLIKNILLLPFWAIFQFFTRSVSEAFFILVSETAWRLGLLWGKIKA